MPSSWYFSVFSRASEMTFCCLKPNAFESVVPSGGLKTVGWCTVTMACSLAPITLITFSCTLPKSTESTNRHGNHSFPPLLTEDAALCARCHRRALCTSLGPGRGRSWSQSTGYCHEISCGVSPASSFSFSWGGTVLAVHFQEGEWGSPLWLTPGQGNSGQSWRPAFLETHPSGDYTVRVKPAPFRSCSPRLTFKCLKSEKRSGAELSGREVGCTGRLALLSAGLCSGDSTGHRRGSPCPGSYVGAHVGLPASWP